MPGRDLWFSGYVSMMRFYILMAVGFAVPVQGHVIDSALCKSALIGGRSLSQRVTAILEFDGLEHTFLSGISCPCSRSIEVVKGFSIPGKKGEELYRNIIRSAKISSPGKRYGVRFSGAVTLRRNASGEYVAAINSVFTSGVVLIGS
jgi:hypothetical protein